VSAPERPIPYRDALRAELVAAIGRRRRRLVRVPRRLVLAAAAAVLAVAVPLGAGLVGGRGGRALAISDRGGTITVRLLDAAADPAKVSRELRDAGVDAEVSSVPVPPGQAGTWVAAVGPPELGGQLERAGAVLRLPAATPGRIELVIGRPARRGERYAVVAGELDASPRAGRPPRWLPARGGRGRCRPPALPARPAGGVALRVQHRSAERGQRGARVRAGGQGHRGRAGARGGGAGGGLATT
jgi:hypothetical protein